MTIDAQRHSYLETREGFDAPPAKQCQYPRGERPNYDFCGEPVAEGRSYCQPHYDTCTRRPEPDKRPVSLKDRGSLMARYGVQR